MVEVADKNTEGGKKGKKILFFSCVFTLLLGGFGGYYLVNNSLIFSQETDEEENELAEKPLVASEYNDEVSFVPLTPMTVSLGDGAESRYLKFSANLEVPKSAKEDVLYLLPRVSDALHSFLHALDETDIKNQESFLLLRSLMLHRVQLVLGEDRVTDILVSEFILN